MSQKTDDDGKVALGLFEVGDEVELQVESGENAENVKFNVDREPGQSVSVKWKVD